MSKVISIRFKDKNKAWRGAKYNYELNKNEEIPECGDIIRLMDNNYNYLHYGTRVKVEEIRDKIFTDIGLQEICYVKTSLDD